MDNNELKAAVGLSRKWDARDAGREVAENTLKQLDSNPDFFLLFTTIHYEKHGGFQEFLNGVWDVLPEGTPLVGGTISGFVNNKGCFTRGATAIAVSYPNMDISVGIGNNTKRNPKKAAKQCYKQIKKQLDNSEYQNKILFNFISGPSMPQLPFIGQMNTIKSKILGNFLSYIGMKLTSIAGYGVGKEEDIIEVLSSLFKDFHIIGGSTVDDGKMNRNYQFCGKNFFLKSMVCLGISIDRPFFIDGNIGLRPTDINFNITRTTSDGRIITRINHKPAKKILFDLFGLSEHAFRDLDLLYRTTFYYPIGFEDEEDYTTGIGAIAGNNIMLAHKAKSKNATLLSAAGADIINTIDLVLSDYDVNQYGFVFASSCEARLETLGNKIFNVKEKFDSYFKDVPYLVLYMGGENLVIPDKIATARIHSFNLISV